MDDGRPVSAPSRFWELRGRSGTATTAVVAIDDGFTRVIAEDSARADPLSLTRTRDAAAWTSARLVLRCLRLLRREAARPRLGTASRNRRTCLLRRNCQSCGAHGGTGGGGKEPRGLAPRRVVRRRARAIGRRPCPPDARTGEPSRALPRRPVPHRGRRPSLPVRRGLLLRHAPGGDLGLGSRAGRRVVAAAQGARIATITSPTRSCSSTRERSTCFPRPAKRPESSSTVPSSFPHEWRLERVLLDGLTAVDATVHIEDGLVWLFANVMEGHEDRGQLWLFSSPSLDGEWRPHPRNPIVTDPGTARPAGRLFRREGVLIRPSQDCLRGYGRAVVLNRVDVLSPNEYRETPMGRIEPSLADGNRGHSHIHIRLAVRVPRRVPPRQTPTHGPRSVASSLAEPVVEVGRGDACAVARDEGVVVKLGAEVAGVNVGRHLSRVVACDQDTAG